MFSPQRVSRAADVANVPLITARRGGLTHFILTAVASRSATGRATARNHTCGLPTAPGNPASRDRQCALPSASGCLVALCNGCPRGAFPAFRHLHHFPPRRSQASEPRRSQYCPALPGFRASPIVRRSWLLVSGLAVGSVSRCELPARARSG